MDPENSPQVSVFSDLETLCFLANKPLPHKRIRLFSEAANDYTGHLDTLQSTMTGLEPPTQHIPILPSAFVVDDARSQSPSPHPCASPKHYANNGYYHQRRPRESLGKTTTFSPPKSSTNTVDLLALGGPDGSSTISGMQVLKEYNTNDPLEPPIMESRRGHSSLASCSHAPITLPTNSPSHVLENNQIPSSILLSPEISPQTLDIVWSPHESVESYPSFDSDFAILPSMEATITSCPSSSNLALQQQALRGDFGSAQNHFSTVPNMKNHQVCGLVFEAFKNPENPHGGLVNNPFLSTVNCHESLRTILAIKILFENCKQVEDPSLTIPRTKVYKAYYTICQKLMYKNPTTTNSSDLQQNFILGPSALGKVIKYVYPTLVTKRLGKRGTSKAHYVGITWNESVVDEEVSFPVDRKLLHSFVECSSSYPGFDFSPRSWRETPNSSPKPSEWAKDTMEKSLNVLRNYDIDFEPLQEGIYGGRFSTDCFSSTVIAAVEKLSSSSASKETFLHLYLAVILLILPSIIASDQEVSRVCKVQLRESVKKCIAQLESEVGALPCVNRTDRTKFTRILSKLTVLNEMTSCSVKTQYSSAV
ncbi:hypothetical protein JCM33374_g1639 [Metschnikowia sp. JCM 33374]|nr:hypothetical protein JCM33374_g1639 [Metschnikowia sp. JCM 33374]